MINTLFFTPEPSSRELCIEYFAKVLHIHFKGKKCSTSSTKKSLSIGGEFGVLKSAIKPTYVEQGSCSSQIWLNMNGL